MAWYLGTEKTFLYRYPPVKMTRPLMLHFLSWIC